MTRDPSVYCVIPARAGSTRVADKNLRTVGGVTLLERAVLCALETTEHVVVSTDSERYAGVARAAGAMVPALRPPELATATARVDAALHHAMQWAPSRSETVVLLQPTSPFTSADDVRATVRALATPGAATAMTAIAVDPVLAFAYAVGPDGLARPLTDRFDGARTQDVPPLGVPTGAVYAAPAARLAAGGPLVVAPVALVFVDPERAVDIDDEADLARAEAIASGVAR